MPHRDKMLSEDAIGQTVCGRKSYGNTPVKSWFPLARPRCRLDDLGLAIRWRIRAKFRFPSGAIGVACLSSIACDDCTLLPQQPEHLPRAGLLQPAELAESVGWRGDPRPVA